MNAFRLLQLSSLTLAAALLPASQPAAPKSKLEITLEKLNAASAKFTSAQADVHKVFYNAVIKADDDTQDGTIYFLRDKSSTQMGLKTTGPGARTVEAKNGAIRVYNPKLNCFDSVNKPGIDTYLTLGFGGSGKDLANAWNITDLGPEMIDGIGTEKLELIPKDPGVGNNISKFTVWIDLTRGVSLKQVLLDPSRNLQTATYTHIQTSLKVDTKPFAIKGKPCGK